MPYAISGGHEITLKIAEDILKQGGNAFDASIAAHLAMYLTEPCMASAGAGGFALCYTPDGTVQMLDFFTQTPLSKSLESELDFSSILVNFGNESEEFHIGMGSIAVPGSIAGIFAIYERYASMPFKAIIEPVRDLARSGVLLNTFQSLDIHLLEEVFRASDDVKDIFFKNDQLIVEGDLLHLAFFEDFLDFLEREGRRGFYEGEISRIVDRDSRAGGGFIRREDFENYSERWCKALVIPYRDHQVHLANAPGIGGAMAAILLSYLNKHKGNWYKAIEQYKNRNPQIHELSGLLHEAYPGIQYHPFGGSNAFNGTSHFNIMDRHGNAIALTCTIGEGSGYFVPGTHMQMNNMLGESFLLPSGFHSWPLNKRLNSMMTPSMILDSDLKLKLVCGSGGAGRIPYVMSQVIANYLNGTSGIEELVLAPRILIHEQTVHYESAYKGYLPSDSECRAWQEQSLFFGGVHAIGLNGKGKIESFGDPRRYGAAISS